MKKYINNFCKPYWCLAFLRILLVFAPQTGYIHPDEYFQSIEVFSGHFFDIEVDKPWEYNSTFPIRSAGINYFTVGFSYMLLKICHGFAQDFGTTLLTPYTLIVFPRVLFAILTFIVDYTLYKMSIQNNEKYKAKITILATSYVMIVYGTHTFSNVIELMLFSLLLRYVTESLTFSNIVVKQQEYLNKRYVSSKTNVEKAKIHKLKLMLSPHSFKNCLKISTIIVIGFFNRPTFLAYAVCPVFFWLYRGIGFKSISIMQFYYRMIALVLCALPSLIFFVLVDSCYYGYISFAEVEFFDININNFVFTPLNFLKYNADSRNLAVHGLHPRYLHIVVNMPLLFNVLAGLCFLNVFTMIIRCFKGQWHYLPTVRSIKGLMTTTLIVPVLLLSIFPHQEPRFLIPVIIPLVYLYAETILPEKETTLTAHSTKRTLDINDKSNKIDYNYLFNIWVIINAILILFYGFVHQGGIYSATVHLSNKLHMKPNINFQIVTSHIYSIPEALFLQKSTRRLYVSNSTIFKLTKRVKLYQEGSEDLEKVILKISALRTLPKNDTEFYFLYPSSLQEELDKYMYITNATVYFKDCMNYFPHLSTEAFPDLWNIFNDINLDYFTFTQVMENLKDLFNLKLCKVFSVVNL